ncbi:hypothetical protein SRHO_G00009580 [Serrasalmus rhombeus]
MAKKRANKRIKALETAEEASNVPGEKEHHEGTSSMSKCEFLEEKLRWQEQKIKDLEDERDFLRDQLRNKGII